MVRVGYYGCIAARREHLRSTGWLYRLSPGLLARGPFADARRGCLFNDDWAQSI